MKYNKEFFINELKKFFKDEIVEDLKLLNVKQLRRILIEVKEVLSTIQ
ncbi:MAG: hypothetical protein Q4A42_02970 [Tissierellia bacterium]|nr:hypothetical protein [Tissierellia bacterium]